MRVVMTGGTGLVGIPLIRELRDRGDVVVGLTRDPARAKQKLDGIEWVAAELETPGPWCDVLTGADAIVHLAGEAVGDKRWDAQQKQRIRDSRVESTRVIVEAIGKLERKPAVLVSASGTDFYPYAIEGLGDEEEVTEVDPPGEQFLARVCRDWEKEARAAEAHGVRVACLRVGLVIGSGLALDRLSKPFKFFVGGRIGSGEQWMPWVGLRDAVTLFANAVHDERYRGSINAVTDSARNKDMARALGKALGRPSWLPAPKFGVKLIAGEFAEVILNGRRVVPAKLRELGYQFQQPDLEAAFRDSL
jgi:uncharacterized protein (TIGR01777 family)